MINIIMSGLRSCNGRCAYCAIKNFVHNNDFEFQYDWDKLKETLDNYIGEDNKYWIWGADPVVSFNSLKKTVSFLREYNPNCIIYTSTNGSTLTDEVIEYLNNNDIHLQLSHDGIAEELKLPFDPILKYNIQNINHLYINCVINYYNYNIPKNIEYFEKNTKDIYISFSLPQFGINYSNKLNTTGFFNGEYREDLINKPFGDMDIHGEAVEPLIGYCAALLYNNKTRYILNVPIDKYFIDYRKGVPLNDVSCLSAWRGLNKGNNIDTLGNYTQCNLLDSLHEKKEMRRNELCDKCKYRYSALCGTCFLQEPVTYCNFRYRLNMMFESLTNNKENI